MNQYKVVQLHDAEKQLQKLAEDEWRLISVVMERVDAVDGKFNGQTIFKKISAPVAYLVRRQKVWMEKQTKAVNS